MMHIAEKNAIAFQLDKVYKPIVQRTIALFVASKQIEEESRLSKKNYSFNEIKNILLSSDFKTRLRRHLGNHYLQKEEIALLILNELGITKDSEFQYLHDELSKLYGACVTYTMELVSRGRYMDILSHAIPHDS